MFQEHWRSAQKVWDVHSEASREVANKTIRDYYARIFLKNKKEDARIAKKGLSDPMQSEMQRLWLSRHNMREAGPMKSKKKGKTGNSDARVFRDNFRRSAMRSAAFICAKSLNHGGEPLDFKLKAGMTLRSEFKLPGKPSKGSRLLAKEMSG